MSKLSITTAWNEAAAFVKREAGLLIPIALGLVALPTALLQLMAPEAAPGQQPEAGAWMLLIIPIAIVTSIGTLAITILALGRETVVGSALSLAARRVWSLLGASLLLALAIVVALIPVTVILALLVQNQTALVAMTVILLFPLMLILWVRLMLMTPVAGAEGLGPVAILKRSWALTRGHTGKLLGFMLLVIIAFVVLAAAVSMVIGILVALLLGPPDPGSLAFFVLLLVGALLNTAFVLYFASTLARIYAQLAGQPTSGT